MQEAALGGQGRRHDDAAEAPAGLQQREAFVNNLLQRLGAVVEEVSTDWCGEIVAVVGATGQVGKVMRRLLDERDFFTTVKCVMALYLSIGV